MKRITMLLVFLFAFTVKAQIAEKQEDVCPLLIGETIPNVELIDVKGDTVETQTLFTKKTVLIFYRGGWCPYCNAQLADMQKIESEIVKLGYQIIAVSPDAPEFLKESEEQKQLTYQLFSDAEGKLTQAVGLAYSITNPKLQRYTTDKNPGFLPIPAVYILDETGKIQFMYASPNFATRLKAPMLISVLRLL